MRGSIASAACRRSRPFRALVSCADADPGLCCAALRPWLNYPSPYGLQSAHADATPRCSTHAHGIALILSPACRSEGDARSSVGRWTSRRSRHRPAPFRDLPHTTGSAGGNDGPAPGSRERRPAGAVALRHNRSSVDPRTRFGTESAPRENSCHCSGRGSSPTPIPEAPLFCWSSR